MSNGAHVTTQQAQERLAVLKAETAAIKAKLGL